MLGCGQPHGAAGHNIARVAALRAGLPVTTAGVTVNRFCNSGLQAIVQAAHMVMQRGRRCGDRRRRRIDHDDGARQLAQPLARSSTRPALYMAMGETAEVVAKRYNVTREAQDEFALASQQRTARAQQDGFFRDELAPMQVTSRRSSTRRRGEKVGEEDALRRSRRVQPSRHDARRPAEAPAGLRHDERHRQRHRRQLVAALRRRLGDARHVDASARSALGIEPLLVFRGYAVAGCEPDEMGIGPVFAVPKLLKRQGLARRRHRRLGAERSVRVAGRLLPRSRSGIPMERFNPNGGSIAIGHPFGMTGSRLVGTLASEMKRRQARYGVVTMCVGGGQGGAALFERA